ncbi:MAG: hypothetical protein HGB22_10385 [Chlorobiaceae bacterium]|nr:hypothetical protein [Chlorobiaceae bacterium]
MASGENADQVNASAIIVNPVYSTSGNLNAGSYKQGVGSGNLSGADASNYTISYTTESANYMVTAKIINLDGTKPYDGTVNFKATNFGDNGFVSGIGSETLQLIGTGTVGSPMISPVKQHLVLGTLTLNDGANGGSGANYTLTGGTHFGTIVNNPSLIPSNIPPEQVDEDPETIRKRRRFQSTTPDDPLIKGVNYTSFVK